MSVSEKMKGNTNAEKWDLDKCINLLEFVLFKIDLNKLEHANEIDCFFGYKKGSVKYILNKFNLYGIVLTKLNSIKKTRKSFIERRKATKNELKKQNKYIKNKYKTNPNYRLRHCFSSLLRYHLKQTKNKDHTFEVLGYSLKELKKHLEENFDNYMNWDNYGSYWHIDHIKPASFFNQLNKEDFLICWGLSNLQPLEASKNMSKGNRYECTKRE